MDVSIVIPVKNGGKRFAEVLGMVFSQETKYEYEVICVDSGSTDGSLDLMRNFPVRLYEIPPEEFGHGRTRNYGAAKGTGRFIAFITQDALPADEHWLDSLVSAMEIDDGIAGGFGCHLAYPDANIFDKRDLPQHFARFGSENHVFSIDDRAAYDDDIGLRLFLSFFSDNNSCLRRSVWEKYPYDDVDYAEDQIWMRRMLELGYKKVYAPRAMVYHSHDYPVWEYCKRCFDDLRAHYRIHDGFKIVPSARAAAGGFARAVINDRRYIFSLSSSKRFRVKWMKESVGRAFGRFIIGYFACRYYEYPRFVREFLDKHFSQQYKKIRE